MNSEVLDKIIELTTAAFRLVAALAWNAAIQALFIAVFDEAGDLVAKFFYAILANVIVRERQASFSIGLGPIET
jgi:Family of unknown function (DUF5654)